MERAVFLWYWGVGINVLDLMIIYFGKYLINNKIMRRILVIVMVFGFIHAVKAEYNGYHLSVIFEQNDGSKILGYMYIASQYLNPDLIQNTGYLKKQFLFISGLENGSIIYYKNRISYKYDGNNGKQSEIFKLIGETELELIRIKEIKIIEKFDFGYLMGISNNLTLKDLSWLKTNPIEKFTAGGYLCSYEIFVHKKTPKISEVEEELESKMREWTDIELDYENGDKFDNEITKIINKLNGEKVVVITFCSC